MISFVIYLYLGNLNPHFGTKRLQQSTHFPVPVPKSPPPSLISRPKTSKSRQNNETKPTGPSPSLKERHAYSKSICFNLDGLNLGESPGRPRCSRILTNHRPLNDKRHVAHTALAFRAFEGVNLENTTHRPMPSHPTTAKAQAKSTALRGKAHQVFVTAAKTHHTRKTVG